MLNEARTDYEVVNVLDEQYNPGVREAIKSYSQWPTIPQVCLCFCFYFPKFGFDLAHVFFMLHNLAIANNQHCRHH